MKEELIKFETAKLAYNKGYNVPYKGAHVPMYCIDGEVMIEKLGYHNEQPETFDVGFILAPTQSLLQKWLREKHGLNVAMSFKPNIKKWDFIIYPMALSGIEYVKYYRGYYKDKHNRKYDTYEEALEDGLLEGLNLIKTEKDEKK